MQIHKQCNLGRLQVGTVLNKDQKQRFFCDLIGQIGVRTLNKEHEIVAIRCVTQTVTL